MAPSPRLVNHCRLFSFVPNFVPPFFYVVLLIALNGLGIRSELLGST